MRLIIQRVKQASVTVENKLISSIGPGVLVLFGVHKNDNPSQTMWLAKKLLSLRIFPNEQGKMHLSLTDLQASALIVSQFTLYCDCKEGRRPDCSQAAPAHLAQPLYNKFVSEVKQELNDVQTGLFGAYMHLSLVNEGPLTFTVDAP